MNTSRALALPPDFSALNGKQVSPSVVNSYRINQVMGKLSLHAQPGNRSDPYEFFKLCISLSRGIDYALANGEIPEKAKDLPILMKQMCQRKNDELSQAAIMVLMISVKNASKIGWFQTKESEEIYTIADEIAKIYCSMGNVNAGPSSCHSTLSTIMKRFYPKMKLGPILVSIEAKPGYGASAVDFHITKSKYVQDKIYLLVAQTDNIETSACLISPQQVNFLLNGKGVKRRTNVQMESGPQMPTNVTGMLKFGTNLLQAVGQFNGHYVILVAYMSVTSLPEHPVLQDYVQPGVTSVDSDIIEGPSKISLNCPISFTRIKIPVKGHSCKHFQCFDFDNFINMNSERPSWHCPYCNQYVCYADIRLDRNMVEILKSVGEKENTVEVLADGSWKEVLENDHDVDTIWNKAHNCEKEQTEPEESTCPTNTAPNVLDLTNDDDHLEITDTCETADRKPFQASIPNQLVTPNSASSGMNSTSFNHNVAAQIEDNVQSGVYIARGRSDIPTVGVSDHPVLSDTVSPAFNQEAGYDNNHTMNSAMHNQFSTQNNLQLLLSYMNSVVNTYGMSSSIPRHINRTPVAVQALPVQSQALGPQQNSVTNLDSLLPSCSSATPHVSLSNPASADASNSILNDTERWQHFSRSPLNLPQVSGLDSSALQRHSVAQNRVPPVNISAPTQLQNPYRTSSPMNELRNPHLQQALNPRPLQPMRSSNAQQPHIQQGGLQAGIVQPAGATANSQQARVMAPSQVARQGCSQPGIVQTAGATTNNQQASAMAAARAARQSQSVSVQNQTSAAAASFTADSFRGLRGSVVGMVQSVSRPEELFSSQSEQNWRPTGRMRGSLDLEGRQYPDAVRQRIIAPTQPVQSSSSSSRPQPVQKPGVSPQLDVLITNKEQQKYS